MNLQENLSFFKLICHYNFQFFFFHLTKGKKKEKQIYIRTDTLALEETFWHDVCHYQ